MSSAGGTGWAWRRRYFFLFGFFSPHPRRSEVLTPVSSSTPLPPQKRKPIPNPVHCPKALSSRMPLAPRSSQTLIRIDWCFTPSHQMKRRATGVTARPGEAWHDVEVQVFASLCLSGDQTERKTGGSVCDTLLGKVKCPRERKRPGIAPIQSFTNLPPPPPSHHHSLLQSNNIG